MVVKKYYVTVDRLGTTWWFKDAKCDILHRENGPAIEHTNGHKEWHQNNLLHRTDGPAVEWASGARSWYQNGGLHRTDGPAIEDTDGSKYWFQNDRRHRTDGPAIEYADGTKEWYIDGVYLTETEFLTATQPVVEMTVADIEKLLGKRFKIIK